MPVRADGGATLTLARVDARFLLPRAVTRAAVLGDLDGWMEGLRTAGIEVGAGTGELAAAPASLAGAAARTGAPMVLLEGRGGARALRHAGLEASRFLALPGVETPSVVVPLARPGPIRYALERWLAPGRRWKVVRNRALAALLGRGLFPSPRPLLTLGLRQPGQPFLVAAARELGVPADADWFLTAGQGDALSRGVFHLFARDAGEPSWALKFARVPGYEKPFVQDEHGLGIAAAAGGAVVAHAPRFLGRLTASGLHASLETAAVGERLIGFLHTAAPSAKTASIEAVAAWTAEVARQTVAPPGTLAVERERVRTQVLPRWPHDAAPAWLVDEVEAVPAVFVHYDLGTWNVVVDRRGFTAIDWEDARPHGFPLWDLWYFLADALAHLDGAEGEAARTRHFVRLFRGELASSQTLFAWTRRTVDTVGVPPRAVGALATLLWLDAGVSPLLREDAVSLYAPGSRLAATLYERMAEAWLTEPGLGAAWDSWQR